MKDQLCVRGRKQTHFERQFNHKRKDTPIEGIFCTLHIPIFDGNVRLNLLLINFIPNPLSFVHLVYFYIGVPLSCQRINHVQYSL